MASYKRISGDYTIESIDNGNITLDGTTVTVNGNLAISGSIAANLSLPNLFTGNVFASNNIYGGGLLEVTGNITSVSGNISGNRITGTLVTAAQPNITSIGSLSSLTVTGNINGGNLNCSSGSGTFTNIYGTLGTAAQPSITSVGSLTSVTVTGNANVGNIGATAGVFTGAITGSTTLNITGNANVGNLGTSGLITATGNITGGNLTTAGILTVTGNITSSGNVSGNFFVGNGSLLTGVISNIGNAQILNYGNSRVWIPNIAGNILMDVNGVANVFTITPDEVRSTLGVTIANSATVSGTLSVGGNIAGNYILGNGALLTGVSTSSSAITNGTSNVNVVSSGGNVTVGVAGTSNVVVFSSGGANVTGYLTTTGNVTASYLLGNGSQLTGIDATSIQNGTSNVRTFLNGNATVSAAGVANVLIVTSTGANITGTLNATGNANVGNLGATSIVGTLTTASQTNITAVGTLASLTVTGNVSTGNANGAIITGTTSVIGGGITLNANTISSSGSTLTIDPAAAGVTGTVVIAGNLSVQGTTTTYDSTTVTINDLLFSVANNAATAAAANGGGIEVGPAGSSYAQWTYDQPNARWTTSLGINATGNITGGNLSGTSIAGTLTTAAQPNITSVGTLSSLTVTGNVSGGNLTTGGIVTATGNITGGNLSVSTGTITTGNIVNSNANGTGNIGSSTTYFNTVFAKATSAQYADIAEFYLADADYPPGTVLEFGGSFEVTKSTRAGSHCVAGVVSDKPAFIMNSSLTGSFPVQLALLGRVPCRVRGPIAPGDLLVADLDGWAKVDNNAKAGTIIGKSLTRSDFDATIEIVVGKH